MASLVRGPIFATKLEPAFENRFPAYAHISDVKKLDFIFWEYRKANRKTQPP